MKPRRILASVIVERLLKRPVWIAVGIGFVAAVVYLSLAPDPVRAPTIDDHKTGHILAYAWLMLWFAQIWQPSVKRLAVALSLCLLGICLEYLQGLTGYRTFSYSDMIDNSIGVVIGLVASATPLGSGLQWLERTLLARDAARR
jgi:hypothetical protein